MNPKKIKIILYLPLALFFIANLFYFSLSVKAAPNDSMPNLDINKLQVKIPTLTKFTQPTECGTADAQGNKKFCISWIGEYIAAIYKYAIGIVGILAAVVLMIGGVIWIVAGGSATMIGEAKAWIGASLTGLIIALCSYLILFQINPALTVFQPLQIAQVKKEPATALTTGTSTHEQAKAYLENLPYKNVKIKEGDKATSLEGIQNTILNEIAALAKELKEKTPGSSEKIIITSGIDGVHAAGTFSHANGWKVDLRNNNTTPALNAFITTENVTSITGFTKLDEKRDGKTTVYKNKRGFCYAEELFPDNPGNNHWDVYPCP